MLMKKYNLWFYVEGKSAFTYFIVYLHKIVDSLREVFVRICRQLGDIF